MTINASLPPPRLKSVINYIPREIVAQMTPEMQRLASRTIVILETNYPLSGGYNINEKTITLNSGNPTRKMSRVATHESLHAYDWSQNNKPSSKVELSEYDRQRIFKQYWGKRAPVPLVMQTGNYYPNGSTSNLRQSYWRQSVEGQPKTEQFATIGQLGPSRVPHYLRRLYSQIYRFPKLPTVLFTGD